MPVARRRRATQGSVDRVVQRCHHLWAGALESGVMVLARSAGVGPEGPGSQGRSQTGRGFAPSGRRDFFEQVLAINHANEHLLVAA